MQIPGGILLAPVLFLPMPALAQAEPSVQTAGQGPIIVYIHNGDVPSPINGLAQLVADRIFRKIGVWIDWRYGRVPATLRERPIVIDLGNASRKEDRNPIAYALPYEGVHIRVFYDRIEREQNRAAILAHVFAHEITHILQGVVRHSDTGIMKARWTLSDMDQMHYRDLSFTPLDVRLIQNGMAARAEARSKPVADDSAEDAVDSHD